MITEAVEAAVTQAIDAGAEPETWDREGLATQLAMNYVLTVDAVSDPAATPTLPSLVEAAQSEAEAARSSGRSSTSRISAAGSGSATSTSRCCRR
ncbi:MAG: hypothetical protein R2909_22655 [Gemmatimonadales bacterium]